MARLRSEAVAQAPKKGSASAPSTETIKAPLPKESAENVGLQQLADSRSVFLSRVTHELRTPLTSILGFAEILINQENLTEAQRGFCQRIQNSAQQLSGILNQFSDLTRLESGKAELLNEEFSIEEMLREISSALATKTRKQEVELQVDAARSLRPVISDRHKLRQAVQNYIGYAVARSPQNAQVNVRARAAGRGVLITIADQGTPVESLSRIAQGDFTEDRSGYSELSLAVARRSMDLLGAELVFENRSPHGLLISILLPPFFETHQQRHSS